MEIFLKTKFLENWEKRKRSFLKISRNVNFKMLQKGEFWVFLSAVFGVRWWNMSRSPLYHKMEILCLCSSDRIFGGGGARSLKVSARGVNYSYKHFSLFYPVFLISALLTTQRPWILCPVSPRVNPALDLLGFGQHDIPEPTPCLSVVALRYIPAKKICLINR